jgi:hypothetical protein
MMTQLRQRILVITHLTRSWMVGDSDKGPLSDCSQNAVDFLRSVPCKLIKQQDLICQLTARVPELKD